MAHIRPERIRLDRLLVARGLVESREKAQGLILAGQILVDEQKKEKCGALVDAQAALRLLGDPPRYVSRGGLKLEGALEHFRLNPEARVCLDIGASTGGFTDCLLQHGAGKVFAVDGGTNQLDWKLRRDPRVALLAVPADLIVLVKPQFEVGKGQVGKGGIVRDPAQHQEAVARVSRKLLELGFIKLSSMESPLLGAEGNREFFVHAVWKQDLGSRI
jgi:23S rRNA (cytidine1920-2'-O)/16S rRNA (cytidine1409-2'-O)-methyltransferase